MPGHHDHEHVLSGITAVALQISSIHEYSSQACVNPRILCQALILLVPSKPGNNWQANLEQLLWCKLPASTFKAVNVVVTAHSNLKHKTKRKQLEENRFEAARSMQSMRKWRRLFAASDERPRMTSVVGCAIVAHWVRFRWVCRAAKSENPKNPRAGAVPE